MDHSHRTRVEALLQEAADAHATLTRRLPPEIQSSLPVDAQGLTRAIDYLAEASGFSENERRELVRPHALNPAVLHARIFGPAPLARETVLGSFIEGARVRAESLGALADKIGGTSLGRDVRSLLVAHPLPAGTGDEDAVSSLRAAYEAQEQAALMIASALDA